MIEILVKSTISGIIILNKRSFLSAFYVNPWLKLWERQLNRTGWSCSIMPFTWHFHLVSLIYRSIYTC